MPESRERVELRGGPFDGEHISIEWGTTLTIESETLLPDGQVARYRPSRERGVYTFRGLATVVGRLPLPEASS